MHVRRWVTHDSFGTDKLVALLVSATDWKPSFQMKLEWRCWYLRGENWNRSTRRKILPYGAEKRVNNKFITLCGVGYGTRTLHCVHPIFPNMAFPSSFIKTLNFVNLLISVVRLTMTVKANLKKKTECFSSPPASFFRAVALFLLFVIRNVCTNKNQQALLLLQFSSTEYKENSKYIERDGFCLRFNLNWS